MESSAEQAMSKLDRDSQYRIHALNNAVVRAELHRTIKNDNLDVLATASVYYNYLKGDGHEHDDPKAETVTSPA